MITPELIAQIGRQIADAIPETAKTTQQEIEKNVKAVLQATISKLDLVSREEFDTQIAVLKRTREKVEALELLVSQLEQQLVPQKPAAKAKAPRKTKAKKTT